ncbi:hypothetical protein NM208_g14239 [Fusarium decemcellulare]|uniref:Uncharacterized protein n=1 Tax=Fusarium decemcellulare TaxID=57161 RepID=A0ACC1RI91_9HYPO|nr:hypothetical protein NM208_g14239 [Fusarium decemcellulare]
MEARRAQGFRDHEVLLGLPPDQYRIVGNSVAREVAVSLGAVFREAWAQSLMDERRVKGTEATTARSEVPVRMGIELSPAVNIEELPFETASTATDAQSRSRTSRSRTRSSRTPSTTTVTPPPISSGPKRRRSSITAEIRASKTSKTERDNSPSRSTPNAQGRIKPSRLRQSVALDEE